MVLLRFICKKLYSIKGKELLSKLSICSETSPGVFKFSWFGIVLIFDKKKLVLSVGLIGVGMLQNYHY